MQQLCPTVSWGQKKNTILLKVHLKDMKRHEVSLTDGAINFSGHGLGASGENTYSFNLSLFDSVAEKPTVSVTPAGCQIVLTKANDEQTWPRLTKDKTKLPWLRVDFDYLETDDSDTESAGADDEDENEVTVRNLDKMLKNPREIKEEIVGRTKDYLKMIYLFSYNIFQWLLFCAIFANLVITVAVEGIAEAFYVNSEGLFKIGQIVMFLEVLHGALKLTKSSVIPTTMQVGGRALFIFVIIPNEPRLQSSYVVLALFFAYSAVEIFRYPYYMCQVLSKEYYPITWLRYSVWLVLYPVGMALEAVVLYLFIRHRAETMFEPAIASMAPFIFIPIVLLMLIADYTMLRYMWRQRQTKFYGPAYVRALRERRGPQKKPKTT